MNFRELSYKVPPKLLQIAGLGYLIYGIVRRDGNAVQIGVYSGAIGSLLDNRTDYVSNRIKKLEDKITQLERRV